MIMSTPLPSESAAGTYDNLVSYIYVYDGNACFQIHIQLSDIFKL